MVFYKKREVRTVNLFAIITLVSLLFGFTSVLLIKAQYPAPIVLFTTATSFFVLVFNYKKWHTLATYFFVIPININVFVLCLNYNENVGNYQYFFLVIFCVAVLHHSKLSNMRTALFFGITICFFLATKLIDNKPFLMSGVSSHEEQVLLFYNQIIAVTLAMVLVYSVVKLLNKQNQETTELLEKEKESQLKISQSLKEKEVMLAEIQHRVKNNLAVISGLLSLQAEKAPCEQSRELMLESKNRVLSMSLVHNQLYKTENLSRINFKLYLTSLIPEIVKSFPESGNLISIEQKLDNVELEITKAVPVGLIINETITNSLKHAFDKTIEKPMIFVEMTRNENIVTIKLSDNGIGKKYTSDKNERTLGLSLIESLADQIDAVAEFNYDKGTLLQIKFQN